MKSALKEKLSRKCLGLVAETPFEAHSAKPLTYRIGDK